MDEAATSHVWEEIFATDQEALAEFERRWQMKACLVSSAVIADL